MRFAPALLAICGCNQVFGLEQTIPVAGDAQYFDAPADAPFACPPPGQTPQFSRLLHQIPQNCIEYSPSAAAGRAFAQCYEPRQQLAEGPLDGPFTPVDAFALAGGSHFDLAQLVPEGDEVIVRRWEDSSVVGRITVWHLDAAGTPTFDHDIQLPNNQTIDSFVKFGAPSRGPLRRMIVQNGTGDPMEIEFDATGASTLVASYKPADLGLTNIAGIAPALTPDGLRSVLYAASSTASGMFYTDRASLAETFRAASHLEHVPGAPDPYLTGACERLYFSSLGSIFWVQQL
jgi:hypothetical protein